MVRPGLDFLCASYSVLDCTSVPVFGLNFLGPSLLRFLCASKSVTIGLENHIHLSILLYYSVLKRLGTFCRNGQLNIVLPRFVLLSCGIVQVSAISMKELIFGH